ncbi:hypothetical protein [Murinocardiopsis flavida]|uniref:hypothetical protein n=1 Tax=Murinocardiopsis flavida TaxID=645275 RepID=UPI001B80AE9F|nr:hypothetical protein [Murinocardiopsis flavida]
MRSSAERDDLLLMMAELVPVGTKTFTDPRLCAAIVDRLTSNGATIQTGTDSYRLAHTKAQAERADAGGVGA